jgi:hypothetical protein
MFLDSSRYAKVPQDEVQTAHGRTVHAIRLRALPPVTGLSRVVRENDRLDLLAHERFGAGTRFWHIADANSALEAGMLTRHTGDTLQLPET